MYNSSSLYNFNNDNSSPVHLRTNKSNNEPLSKFKRYLLKKRLFKMRFLYQTYLNSSLRDVQYDVFSTFNQFSYCLSQNSSLNELNLSGVALNSLLMIRLCKALEKHSNLKKLDISNTNFSTLCYRYICESLKENKILTNIQLVNNTLFNETFRDLDNLFLENKTIQEINLNFSKMGEEGVQMFLNNFSKSSSLKNIKIANFGVNETICKVLSFCLFRKNTIENLDLSHNKIGEKELELIIAKIEKSLKKKKKKSIINNIILDGNRINGSKALEKLTFLIERKTGLKKLSLAKNKLQGSDLTYLDKLINQIEETLDISRNQLYNNFPVNFDIFMHLKNLNLSYNNLQGKPIKVISDTLMKAHWIYLNLSFCNLNDEDFITIIKSLPMNKELKKLDIIGNEITGVGLEIFPILFQKIQLKEIDLSNNSFQKNDIVNLFNKNNVNLKSLTLNEFSKETKINNSIKIKEDFLFLDNIEKISIIRSPLFLSSILISLKSASNLQELILTRSCKILDGLQINDLCYFIRNTKSLKKLSLSGINLGGLSKNERNEILSSFEYNSSIQILDLSKNKIRSHVKEFLNGLLGLNSLIDLNLSSNYIENKYGDSLAEFLKTKEKLKVLDLSHNFLTYTSFKLLSSVLSDHKNLEILRIGNMYLDIYCLLPLGNALKENRILKILDISHTVFDEDSILSLYKKEKDIKVLNVYNLEMEDFEFNILTKLLEQNQLKITSLNLFGCLFTTVMKKSLIKNIKNLDSLEYLNLSGTSIAEDDIIDLVSNLEKHTKLEHFVLRNLRFSNRFILGLKHFISKNISLKKFDLSDNNMQTLFMKELEEPLSNNKFIEEIWFNNCQLNDDSIIYFERILSKNINLKFIHLEKNHFTDKNISGLLCPNRRSPFNSMNIKHSHLFDSFIEIKNFNILELNLAYTFHKSFSNNLQSFLQLILDNNSPLKTLILDGNSLNDTFLGQLGILLSTNKKISELSLANNKFTTIGFEPFLLGLQKNTSLKILSLAGNFTKIPIDNSSLKIFEETFTLRNKILEIFDISYFCLDKNANEHFKRIFAQNSNICFINSGWRNINTSCAILIINSLEKKYREYQTIKIEIPKLKIFNFSNCKLDDEFCLYFSENILKFNFVEELIINENLKITLIGLKYIYVNMIYHNDKLQLKKVFFETVDYKMTLNNGLAASLTEWGKYANETEKKKIFWQKVCTTVFSKMVAINNKFQYSESFQDFSRKFKKMFIWFFFLLNFMIYIILSISLPINSIPECGKAHSNYSHYVYSIYIFITVLMEIFFWLYYKYHIKDYSETNKKLKKEIFINDVLFILSSLMAKYDLYLDVSFLTLSYTCGFYKTFIASVVILSIKVCIKSQMFISSMIKLLVSIIKKRELSSLNLIAKLSMIQDYYLIGDIMDRYVPGNSKKLKRVCCHKLKRTVNISFALFIAYQKLIAEDLPQVIIQIIYVFVVAKYGPSGQSSSNWIVLVNISKNLVSLLASFYGSASVRPSYLVQADFDEVMKLNKLKENNPIDQRRKTDFLTQSLNIYKKDETINMKESVLEYKKIMTPTVDIEKEIQTIAEEDILHEKDYNIRDRELFSPF